MTYLFSDLNLLHGFVNLFLKLFGSAITVKIEIKINTTETLIANLIFRDVMFIQFINNLLFFYLIVKKNI